MSKNTRDERNKVVTSQTNILENDLFPTNLFASFCLYNRDLDYSDGANMLYKSTERIESRNEGHSLKLTKAQHKKQTQHNKEKSSICQ